MPVMLSILVPLRCSPNLTVILGCIAAEPIPVDLHEITAAIRACVRKDLQNLGP